jgi:hypothetical protein
MLSLQTQHPGGFQMPRPKTLLLVAALFAAGSAHAQNAIVDTLTFFKSTTVDTGYVPFQPGDLVLADDFSNGDPLVSAPRVGTGAPFNYSVLDALQLPVEANGKLSIFANASTTPVSQSALGDPFYSYGVRLLSNANPSVLVPGGTKLSGLGKDSTWSVGADFVPLTPGLGANYQIRLTDRGIGSTASQGNDLIQLQVLGTAGGPRLQLVQQNFLAGTIAVLWTKDIVIPVAADQLRMGFAHLNAGSGVINAYYSFFEGSNSLGGEAIATTGTIFSDELLTRFEVRAAVPVPEPASMALWAVGLLGTLAVARARRRRGG